MSWQMIKGIAPKPEIPIKRCLRLDGVNDYLSLGDSAFYNVGLGEFTFAFTLLKYTDKQNTGIFRTADGGAVNRFACNIINGNVLNIILGNNDGNFDTLNYELGNIYSEFITLIITRKGNNYSDSDDVLNYPTSIRNPANYHVYLEGVLLTPSDVIMQNPKGLYYTLDSPNPKILGAITSNSSFYYQGYYSLFGYWNRALSSVEIQNINNGILDDYMSKGIFLFDGNTLDSSSVQGTMTLINSATPLHITYPYKDGVIPFLKLTSDQVKQFKYSEDVIITKIWKERSSYNGFQYSFDNSTWLSIPDGELVNVYIVVPANTILYIKDSISRANYNVLHLDFE